MQILRDPVKLSHLGLPIAGAIVGRRSHGGSRTTCPRAQSRTGTMARSIWLARTLLPLYWLVGSANAECGIDAANVDFSGANVQLITLDAEGQATDSPFPGGSARWTNVGTKDGQAYDLLVIEAEGSTRTYVPPDIGSAAALSGGFACLGVGVVPSTCTGSGTYDSSWTPVQPQSEACSTGDLVTGGAPPPPPPYPDATHNTQQSLQQDAIAAVAVRCKRGPHRPLPPFGCRCTVYLSIRCGRHHHAHARV